MYILCRIACVTEGMNAAVLDQYAGKIPIGGEVGIRRPKPIFRISVRQTCITFFSRLDSRLIFADYLISKLCNQGDGPVRRGLCHPQLQLEDGGIGGAAADGPAPPHGHTSGTGHS